MLVAPLFENVTARNVYLPPGQWIDYQTGKTYAAGWHKIEAGEIPIVVLVREGAVIPHIKLAQSTAQMDWSELELKVYATDSENAKGLVCLPSDKVLRELSLAKKAGAYTLTTDPLAGKVSWKVNLYSE